MAEVRITRYRATWDSQSHRGTIELQTEGGGFQRLAVTDAAEFAVLANLLQLDSEVYLVDDRLITTQVQPPGLRMP